MAGMALPEGIFETMIEQRRDKARLSHINSFGDNSVPNVGTSWYSERTGKPVY